MTPANTPIARIMIADPVTVDVSQTLGEVRRVLGSERFHHVPVVDDGKLVGIISTTDVLRHSLGDIAAGSEQLDKRLGVATIMQRNVITVSHRATVAEAARTLAAGGFHGLPVVDGHGRLHGIVTSTDLMEFLTEPHAADGPAGGRDDGGRRLKLLEAVFKAAELYLRSGLAEMEQARLERAIEAVREDRS